MGFFSNLRDRLNGGSDDEYYEDEEDYYEDEYDDGGSSYVNEDREKRETSGVLGNTSRPEAESVSVYTRSGRPMSERGADQTDVLPQRDARSTTTSSVRTSASSYNTSYTSSYGSSGRTVAASLPPYVLRPVTYDDVQTVVKRVRTNQPVVLVLQSVTVDTAKRILDFCFGFSCGVNGAVEELGNRVFVVLPRDVELSDADIDKLVADGDLVR